MENTLNDNGLAFDFSMTGGSFNLTSGANKKEKDITLFLSFEFDSRIYRPEFRPEVLWVLQKPQSYVNNLKTLLLGNMRSKLLSFVNNITINTITVGRDRGQKEYYLFIEYSYLYDVEKVPNEIIIQL